MIKVYYIPSRKITREYLMIKQGLVNNPRVELVDNEKESNWVFLFYTVLKHKPHFSHEFLSCRTIFIDYHDKPDMIFNVDCLVYFKRSWVKMVDEGNYTTKKTTIKPPNFYPLTFAIMDEFLSAKKEDREYELTCTLRPHKRHPNRMRILSFIKKLVEKSPLAPSRFAIGEYNQGNMNQFNDIFMQDYFSLLKRSKIVVTCNPSRWEGDFRTWEAFASGALVFVDRMFTPMAHPLIDGKHCIFYEVSDLGLEKLQEKILFFIENPIKAHVIACEGFNFTMKYHRASNRIDEILEIIT